VADATRVRSAGARPGGIPTFFLLLLLPAIFGCGGSPLKQYGSFPDQKSRFGSVGILMDYIMIEGVMDDSDKVDLIQNRRMSAALLTMCADSLGRKGYPVSKSILSSIGLLMKRDQYYRVSRSSESQKLPLGAPPFYVDEQFTADTTLGRLTGFYGSLINLPRGREHSSFLIPEAGPIGERIGCGTLVVLLVGGYNVPVGQGVGKETPNQSQTMGIVTMQGVSQLSVLLHIVDARSGAVIWDDRRLLSGGVIFPEKIYQAAADLLTELP
jgi:hypothetical protein